MVRERASQRPRPLFQPEPLQPSLALPPRVRTPRDAKPRAAQPRSLDALGSVVITLGEAAEDAEPTPASSRVIILDL